MADQENIPTEFALPEVEDAVMAEISGPRGLSQDQLWDTVGNANVGALAPWALTEAEKARRVGTDPRDAFIQGVGYAVTALLRQAGRNADKQAVEDLIRSVFESVEDAPVGPTPGENKASGSG